MGRSLDPAARLKIKGSISTVDREARRTQFIEAVPAEPIADVLARVVTLIG